MNLSRFTTLLIILSIRLFFVTGPLPRQGFTAYFLLSTLLAVEFARLVPLGLAGKLW